jgi:hypothetical protein
VIATKSDLPLTGFTVQNELSLVLERVSCVTVPVWCLLMWENREVGESPARAQRCKGDDLCECHWSNPGRRCDQMNLSQKTGQTAQPIPRGRWGGRLHVLLGTKQCQTNQR